MRLHLTRSRTGIRGNMYAVLWLSGDNFFQPKHPALLPLGTTGSTKGASQHCCGRKLPWHLVQGWLTSTMDGDCVA